MDKDKQIEEMAKIAYEWTDWNFHQCEVIAESIYNKDYRKASEVAREIFERLYSHRKFDGHTVSVWLNDLVCIAKEYGIDLEGDAELKKKYTENL